MDTGTPRKNSEKRIPPAGGGFALARLLSAFLMLLLALAATLSPGQVTGTKGVALAQPAPRATDADTSLKDLVTLDEEIGDLNSRLGELESESDDLKRQISENESEVEDNREKLADKRRALNNRARNIYMNGRNSKLVMLFSSDDISDFFKRAEYLDKVTAEDAKLIKGVKRESKLLDDSLADLKRRNEEVDEIARDLASRRDRLLESKSDREELLARAGDSREQLVERSSEVESKFDEINPPESEHKHTGRFLTMRATAYSPQEPGLSDTTASGLKAQRGVVAVDPSVIPLGTRLHVEGYGYAIAADTGSAIKGNRIDLCFNTLEEVYAYGWRTVKVEILD